MIFALRFFTQTAAEILKMNTVPATQAVMKQAAVPAIIALKALSAISFFFEGAMLARKKIKVYVKQKCVQGR